MKKYSISILFVEMALMVLFVLYPSAIDSVSWVPPRAPSFLGVFKRNQLLQQSEVFAAGELSSPEDIAIDKSGRLYTGTAEGDIVRLVIKDDGTEVIESWVNTGGIPLGLAFDSHQNLIVCDGDKGLLSINVNGEIKTLTNAVNGELLNFAKSVTIANDGKIYFTEASTKWVEGDYINDLLEAKPYARVLMYDPSNQQTSVLMDGLYFAGGIALSTDSSFLLVTETWRYSVKRYWLKGRKAGTTENYLANLPGFPGGISNNGKNEFWLALVSIRNPVLDKAHEVPWLKNGLSKLPRFLTPDPIPYGLVLRLDEKGPIKESLHDPGGKKIKEIYSAEEHGGYLYFGTFKGDRIGRYKL